MMESHKILEKQIIIRPKDNQTNTPLRFQLDRSYERLIIRFQYGPAYASSEEALPLIRENLRRYLPPDQVMDEAMIRRFLPLENLVTLSLAHEGQYLGARHTKERVLTVVISPEEASLGFPAIPIQAGEWELQLNVHCVASKQLESIVRIYAEGGEENAPVRSGTAQSHAAQ